MVEEVTTQEEESSKSALEEERALSQTAIDAAISDAPAISAAEPEKEKPAETPAPVLPVEPAPADEETKTVPVAALLEERDKRQKLELELATERARREEREAIRQQQEQARAAAEQAEAARQAAQQGRPGDDDPIAQQEWDERQQRETERRAVEARIANAENQALVASLAAERAAFVQTTPDYKEALDWMLEREKKSYMDAGLTEQEALQEINRRAGGLIQIARARGKNVTATFYNLAVNNGYVKKAAAPAAPATEPAKPAAPASTAPTAQEKLETAERGKDIASLGQGAGGQSQVALSDDQIDAMSQIELREWLKNPKNEARYRRMCGQE